MKKIFQLSVIIGLAIFCSACNKADNPGVKAVKTLDTAVVVTPASASIIGKWNENQQRIQFLNVSSGAIIDTTYRAGLFTNADFFQFKSDSTAVLSQSAVRTANGILTSSGTVGAQQYFYRTSGSTLRLTYQFGVSLPSNADPGPYFQTIVQLDLNTLIIHWVYKPLDQSSITVTDTYYTRAK